MVVLAAHSGATPGVRPHVFRSPLGLWLVMALVAVVNGGLREALIIPHIGESAGHVVSTVLLVGAILAIAGWFFTTSAVEYRRAELVLVGIGWTVLTVGFEFLVGYLEGTPVAVTLGQYDVLSGQVWILVPLTLLFAPLFFGSWRSN